MGSKLDAGQYRKACRDYALEQVSEQRDDFIRLGILGQWEKPYLTLDRNYEAEQIRAFATIVKNGHLIYGHKPVHWCLDCKSALAEAEVEYKDKESSAVDVRFKIIDTKDFLARTGFKLDQIDLPIYLPIWTTTLWTLPANQAVVLGKDLKYLLVATESNQGPHFVIVSEGLQESIRDRWQAEKWNVIGSVNPSDLDGLQLQHPFYERQVPTLIGDYVTLEAGTGAVHTAPAHGHDDFIIGQKNNLPLENPVDDFGIFTSSTEYFSGQHVFKAESSISEKLRQNNNLIHQQPFIHSYPHCWRHKTPLIFRATPQWFISMDQMNFRAACLAAIETVEWTPDWGKERIQGMIESRPDWCISRQRFWGVPIPLFIHKETDSLHPNTVDLLHQIADKVEEDGVDGWFSASTEDFLGEEAPEYCKTTDTMDVWMDSGLAHYAVSQNHTNIDFPADLYLEGSDQHRGWFQSSLLTSVAMNAQAPYKQVLTHGFAVDETGKKMSKSLGNVIAPQAVINNLGADILRLWVASTDYSSEISISDQILKRNSDAYRRIRNTARFLLGNLNDFNPNEDLLPVNELLTLDQWVINRLHEIQAKILEDYNLYAFHRVCQFLHNFCVVDMGGFYLDVIKDRLYTTESHSHARKSAQTVLYHIAESMTRWIAPILSFTADEVWQFLPGDRAESVFLADWYHLPKKADIGVDWSMIDVVQQTVAKALEVGRNEGVIGSSLDASITIYADDELADLLASFGQELHFLFITSDATLASADNIPQGSVEVDGVAVSVLISKHQKCIRCWHRDESVGQSSDHPELCARCIGNITGKGELRLHF